MANIKRALWYAKNATKVAKQDARREGSRLPGVKGAVVGAVVGVQAYREVPKTVKVIDHSKLGEGERGIVRQIHLARKTRPYDVAAAVSGPLLAAAGITGAGRVATILGALGGGVGATDYAKSLIEERDLHDELISGMSGETKSALTAALKRPGREKHNILFVGKDGSIYATSSAVKKQMAFTLNWSKLTPMQKRIYNMRERPKRLACALIHLEPLERGIDERLH